MQVGQLFLLMGMGYAAIFDSGNAIIRSLLSKLCLDHCHCRFAIALARAKEDDQKRYSYSFTSLEQNLYFLDLHICYSIPLVLTVM